MLKKRKHRPIKSQRELMTVTQPRSPISEQYRIIRTNIEFSKAGQSIQTFMCTSATPAEGKTTTIANVAVVFAQQGKKVLLIDTDLRRPSIHTTFRIENRIGITNVLTSNKPVKQAIVSTKIKNLSILPSGPIPPNPAELLGSPTMKELVDALKQEYDMILFDTPPVLAVTDPQLIGNLCDGALLVVKSNQVKKDELTRATEMLQQANVNILGMVLNSRKQKEDHYYYGK